MGIETYALVGFYTALGGVLGILDLGIGATMNRELARYSVNEDISGPQRDIVREIAIFIGGIVVLIVLFIAHTWINIQFFFLECSFPYKSLMNFSYLKIQ